jgi:tetratricopeptide (TPR) repeat protein
MRSLLSCLACLVAFSMVSASAEAGPAEDEARTHAKAGTAAFNLGHYDEAVAEYESAYKLVPDPVFLFNIGQAHRLAGNAEKALVAYRSYLRTAPVNAPNREQVEKHVEQLEAATRTPGPAPKPSPPVARKPDLTPTAEPPASPALDVTAAGAAAGRPSPSTPVYKTWWFWAGVGAVVVAGTTTAILLSRGQEGAIKGNVDPGVVVLR